MKTLIERAADLFAELGTGLQPLGDQIVAPRLPQRTASQIVYSTFGGGMSTGPREGFVDRTYRLTVEKELFRLENLFWLAEWLSDPIRVSQIDGDRVQGTKSRPMEGAETAWARALISRYRGKLRRLISELEKDLDPNIEHEAVSAPRCRRRGCEWNGRRQHDATYCAGCGERITGRDKTA